MSERFQQHSPAWVSFSYASFLSACALVAGGIVLMYGGNLTVESSTTLATQLGISTTVAGLFIVAVGTSMPELVTSAIAAARGESDLALGNLIGSNLFNTLFVLPAGGIIYQIPVPDGGITDLVVLWLLAIALIPIFFFGKGQLSRGMGAMLVAAYCGYAAFRILPQAMT